jgi:hypothetical protein
MHAPRPSPTIPPGTFHARLYRVAMVRWVDLPKREIDRLGLTPAETRG